MQTTYAQVADALRKAIADFEELKKNDPERAKKESEEFLIKSGIYNEDGTPKEQIVTGMFFGWD